MRVFREQVCMWLESMYACGWRACMNVVGEHVFMG